MLFAVEIMNGYSSPSNTGIIGSSRVISAFTSVTEEISSLMTKWKMLILEEKQTPFPNFYGFISASKCGTTTCRKYQKNPPTWYLASRFSGR